MRSQTSLLLVVALSAGVTTAAKTKLTSTWVAPGTMPGSFAGKKVAALVISSDESLRVSGEEAPAREQKRKEEPVNPLDILKKGIFGR
jgi:phage tail sheath gpL-like